MWTSRLAQGEVGWAVGCTAAAQLAAACLAAPPTCTPRVGLALLHAMLVVLGAATSFAPAGRSLQPCLPRGQSRQQAFCTSAGGSGKKTRTSLMVAAEELEESVPEEAFACTTEEHEMMKAIGGALASAYGEITRAGFSSLGKKLRLESDDVFVDCGSGRGKTAAQAAREFGVARAYGIELAASRHDRAVADLERSMTPEDAAAIALFQGVRRCSVASPSRRSQP